MPKICISYRRSDSTAVAGRIYDRLVARYGAESIFIDMNDIPYGADFREHIQAEFRHCGILIVVVGGRWLGQQTTGTSRIHDSLDPVRVEVETALREHIFIIPVLVDDAAMPSRGELPQSIEDFAFRNAIRMDSGLDFNVHAERLLGSIDQILGKASSGLPTAVSALDRGLAGGTTTRLGLTVLQTRSSDVPTYLVVTAALLLLAHYLIVIKLDLDPIYLQLMVFAVPLASGFLLFWNVHHGLRSALLMGFGVGLVAVIGMLTVVGLVDKVAIVPTDVLEWQEAIEYLGSITLATFVGNFLAQIVRPLAVKHVRLFR